MKKNNVTVKIVFCAMMAAIIYVVTLLRFPLLGSKVHFANAMCLISGLLLGPAWGGVAAGLGSAMYDCIAGYDIIEVLVTFVSKFAMAWVCAMIARKDADGKNYLRVTLASAAGALTYVALYMLKTFIKGHFVELLTLEATWIKMAGKLPASLINAAVAIIAAPILYAAIRPALRAAGILQKLQ